MRVRLHLELVQALSAYPADAPGQQKKWRRNRSLPAMAGFCTYPCEATRTAWRLPDRENGQLREIQRLRRLANLPGASPSTGDRWLFVANEASNSVSLFNIDPASGRFERHCRIAVDSQAVTIAFYARKQQ